MILREKDILELLSSAEITIGLCGMAVKGDFSSIFNYNVASVRKVLITEFDVVRFIREMDAEDKDVFALFATKNETAESAVNWMRKSIAMNDSFKQIWNDEGDLVSEHVKILYSTSGIYELVDKKVVPIVFRSSVQNKFSDALSLRMRSNLDIDSWNLVSTKLLKDKLISKAVLR